MPTDEGERRARSVPQEPVAEGTHDAAVEGAAPDSVESEGSSAAVNAFQAVQDRLQARAAGLLRAAEAESKRRQEEADMVDFKRQIREVEAAKKMARTYTVQPGDTLSAIALGQLGDASRWPEILQANGDKISNPNLIYPGQELTIP